MFKIQTGLTVCRWPVLTNCKNTVSLWYNNDCHPQSITGCEMNMWYLHITDVRYVWRDKERGAGNLCTKVTFLTYTAWLFVCNFVCVFYLQLDDQYCCRLQVCQSKRLYYMYYSCSIVILALSISMAIFSGRPSIYEYFTACMYVKF